MSVGLGAVATALPVAHALSVLPITHERAVAEADGIVRGTVIERSTSPIGDGLLPITSVVLRVDQRLAGIPGLEVVLEFAGGTVDGVAHDVADLPVPEVGDELIAFYRTARDARLSNVVGVNQWYFRLADHGQRMLDHGGRVVVGLADGLPVVVDADRLDAVASASASGAAPAQGTGPREVPPDGVIGPDGVVRARPGRHAMRGAPAPMDWTTFRAATLDLMARPDAVR